tara:strand:- start:6900 stop:7211 length:312 start_codon:yes stop_codon:yes gene_type:complete
VYVGNEEGNGSGGPVPEIDQFVFNILIEQIFESLSLYTGFYGITCIFVQIIISTQIVLIQNLEHGLTAFTAKDLIIMIDLRTRAVLTTVVTSGILYHMIVCHY